MSGLEPAFSHGAQAPLAVIGGLRPEPDDPQLPIPRGLLITDTGERQTIDPGKADVVAPPAAPLGPPPARHRSKGWTATLAISCLLHAVAALAFLSTGADKVMIAGSENAGLLLLGNAARDDASAGDRLKDATQVTLVTMLTPRPVETVQAEPVEPTSAEVVATLDPIRPLEEEAATPLEREQSVQPAGADAPQPARADPAPAILTAQAVATEHDPATVVPPAEQVTPTPPAEVATGTPDGVTPDQPKPVEKKPVSEKPVKKAEKNTLAKKKTAAKEPAKEKKPAAKAARQADSGGIGQADARRGVAGGDLKGTRTETGKSGTLAAAGNAAVSNYPGKVAASLKRAARGISNPGRSRATGDVRVSFTVTASGDLAGVRIASSSGSPDLDNAALAIVRRAAPFPPIPPEAGRKNWAFTLPLGTLVR